jgi:DNA topoisomerase-1
MPPYVPPGYKNVEIFTDPKSKIYAFGYDSKGRKQIIYNKWFVEKQRDLRFKHILGLKANIRDLKEKIESVLGVRKVKVDDKELQICLIIRLMMLCNFRIGNMKYLKDNGSYGLTTLEWQHIKFSKKQVQIQFIGKKGVLNQSTCGDSDTVRILQKMKEVENRSNRVFSVSSRDVNKYVSNFNPDMTTKDIRTWHANYLYVKYFKQAVKEGHPQDKARTIAITRVAASLHNTPAVCRKNYLLPELIGTRETNTN